MAEQSFQDSNFPDGDCFGCGPANRAGLRIKSFPREDGSVVARWTPGHEHGNGGGGVCGGILGSVLDCHACAAATRALNDASTRGWLWCVTKEFSVEFVRLTPLEPLDLEARVVDLRGRSAEVVATAAVAGALCVRFRGIFVVPQPSAG